MKCPLCSAEHSENTPDTGDGRRYLHCAACGLVWLTPEQRLSVKEEHERYLLHENSTSDGAYLHYLSRLAFALLKQNPLGKQGLDFGCGPSEGMKALLMPKGYEIHSYDPCFFPETSPLERTYDFILCSEAAEHFAEPGLEFTRLEGLLRPGGLLGVSSALFPGNERFSRWHYRRDPTHIVFYSERSVHWLARHFGWELLQLETPYWIFRKPEGIGASQSESYVSP